jgi:phosphoadenosine phosphosulfate reductase
MVSLAPEVPVVWVDTGFCGTDTRRFADQLRRHLRLNLQVYRPQESAISILNAFGVTDPLELDDYQRQQFTEKVKLEPFRRAIKELRPGIWITGIRAEETEHRRALAPVTLDDQGVLKVAPFFSSSGSEVATYLSGHELPVNRGYFDPTKAAPHLECGLHR